MGDRDGRRRRIRSISEQKLTMEERREPRPETPDEGADKRDNELGYRNVEEEQEHDERGSQGPGPGDVPPRET